MQTLGVLTLFHYRLIYRGITTYEFWKGRKPQAMGGIKLTEEEKQRFGVRPLPGTLYSTSPATKAKQGRVLPLPPSSAATIAALAKPREDGEAGCTSCMPDLVPHDGTGCGSSECSELGSTSVGSTAALVKPCEERDIEAGCTSTLADLFPHDSTGCGLSAGGSELEGFSERSTAVLAAPSEDRDLEAGCASCMPELVPHDSTGCGDPAEGAELAIGSVRSTAALATPSEDGDLEEGRSSALRDLVPQVCMSCGSPVEGGEVAIVSQRSAASVEPSKDRDIETGCSLAVPDMVHRIGAGSGGPQAVRRQALTRKRLQPLRSRPRLKASRRAVPAPCRMAAPQRAVRWEVPATDCDN